jgi:hypothetical protein
MQNCGSFKTTQGRAGGKWNPFAAFLLGQGEESRIALRATKRTCG